MKRKFSLLFIILAFNSYSQSFELHNNFRNSKVDTIPFDWYVSLKYNTNNLSFKTSIERDNGKIYYCLSESFEDKNFYLKYLYDTELKADMISTALFYSTNGFKAGFDISKQNEFVYGVLIAFKCKLFYITTIFWDKLLRLDYEFCPKIKINQQMSVGLGINGLYLNEKYKWNSGLTLNYKL